LVAIGCYLLAFLFGLASRKAPDTEPQSAVLAA